MRLLIEFNARFLPEDKKSKNYGLTGKILRIVFSSMKELIEGSKSEILKYER